MMMDQHLTKCCVSKSKSNIWVVLTIAVVQCAVAIEASVASRGEVYMVTSPTAVAMPINDETLLSCEMNIAADKFEWRHYPLPLQEAANPIFPLSLGRTHYVPISSSAYVNNFNSSTLTVKSVNASVAGDYQCLAHYGASVVASTPGRVTVTALRDFSPQDSVAVTVTEGNTIVWACRPPASNPPAYIDYYRNGKLLPLLRGGHPAPPLVLERVSRERDDRGEYTCKASNVIQQSQRQAPFSLTLNVVLANRNSGREAPRFITPVKNVYDVKQGSDVFLECSAVGNPVPNVTWRRLNGSLPTVRATPVPGGLKISNVTASDDDVYICEQRNERGFVTAHIKLNYQEAPLVVQGPNNTTTKEGEDLHLECIVTGSPTPEISWLWNGVSVLRDSQIEAVGNKIYFAPVEKRHAGKVQCFAANVVGIDYGTANLNVIPKQYISTIESVTAPPTQGKQRFHHRKTQQMTPPTRPIITRLTDESVMVRWDVPKNPGLEIIFFKIQYRLIIRANNTSNKSKWETANVDIPKNQKCYEVVGLIPNNSYQFRVAAVYSNQDNKFGQKSAKFFLEQMDFDVKNTLPIPILISTEPINSTSIKIYWEKPPSNVTVEGYIINYMSASSAGDYSKVTVDGDATSYIITHLEPDTMYDIKMQSFTTKSGSEFSPIMKSKTATRIVAAIPISVTSTTTPATTEEPGEMSNIFILVGAGVIVIAVLLSIVIFVIICHKWKRKKNANNSRDANDYVMSPKTNVRTNGTCGLPSNRITITANPLADTDNKSPTMMLEMACLTSQNNNCTAATATSAAVTSVIDSGSNSRQQIVPDGATAYSGHHSKHKRRKRTGSGTESSPMAPTENYV